MNLATFILSTYPGRDKLNMVVVADKYLVVSLGGSNAGHNVHDLVGLTFRASFTLRREALDWALAN